jgi:hypothetical protein
MEYFLLEDIGFWKGIKNIGGLYLASQMREDSIPFWVDDSKKGFFKILST